MPQIPQVLFSTKLVEPGETVTFQFKAPAEAGQYPYVCTFPGALADHERDPERACAAGRGGRGDVAGGSGSGSTNRAGEIEGAKVSRRDIGPSSTAATR